MHRPVLITPPAAPVVTLEEAKAHLRVDHAADDALIEGLIGAATGHLDGWTGVLGRCLVEQTWRQEYDGFARDLHLPLGPVIAATSVTWRSAAGTLATVSPSAYDLRTDAGGRSCVRFDAGYSFPTGLHESRAVAVTYRTGHEAVGVPAPLRAAVLLMVGDLYAFRESGGSGTVAFSSPTSLTVNNLIAPYRRRVAG